MKRFSLLNTTPHANVFYVYLGGNLSSHGVIIANGVRPVVSINSNAVIKSGTGSSTDPYIVKS